MYVAVYDNRVSQGIHLSGLRPKFVAVGDAGPQPLWIMEIIRDAYESLVINSNGELILKLTVEAELVIEEKEEAEVHLSVENQAYTALDVEQDAEVTIEVQRHHVEGVP